jgi:hypothetical protein
LSSVFCVFVVALFTANADPPSNSAPNVFDLPQLQIKVGLLQRGIPALLAKGDFPAAERACRAAVKLVPHDAHAHYNLACALARQEKTDEALASLRRAIELGFRDAEHIEKDDDLKSLRQEADFKQAVEDATNEKVESKRGWQYRVEPSPIEKAVATVDTGNTIWDTRHGVFRTFFKLDTVPPADTPVAKGFGEVGKLLNTWQAEGTVAGNRGDLYDNHDSDHSNMNYGMFPQLTRIEFAEAAKSRRHHHGLQTRFFFNGVTIGNSSTAVTSGPFWRSQARLALTNPRSVALLYLQYFGNHLYVYPEHRDHDPGPDGQKAKGRGDVFAVSTPYLIISQGSSGSDRAFLNTLAATLAAFRPDVKATLVRTRTIMPTVQMIFRSCNKQVARPEDYLTGEAHPTVFKGNEIDAMKMVKMAHGITKKQIPPVVQLKVVEEDQFLAGRDYFTAGQNEKLFDTPCAIARVARARQYLRRMVVSAESSKDLNDRPLTYHWAVLRGDADRIQINKANNDGSVVELLVPYHERRPINPGSEIQSNRVDIGAFVHNGAYYSAPAFVTFFYLDHEKRAYDENHRIQTIDYADPVASQNYVDPAIDIPKQWRDEYQYDDSGQLSGWTRIRGESQERFTPDGLLITKTDEDGRPLETKAVRYVPRRRQNRPPVLEQVMVDETAPSD